MTYLDNAATSFPKPEGVYAALDRFARHALANAGVVQPNQDMYRKGVKFLLATQNSDGSWHVSSRATKF